MDIFDNTILCKNCNLKMNSAVLNKNGFNLRVVICPKCDNKITHPEDEKEYQRFLDLKGRDFRVKMRIVGNSYAVSIPKEIVDFIHEQEKIMDDMVRLCFNDARKLSLMFGEEEAEGEVHDIVRNKLRKQNN